MTNKMIPAVAYYRMSSDDQCASIPQQQKEVRAYAKQRDYKIVREYIDEGKSGSKEPEKRVDFQRLLLDATRGDFRAVLCWNASRFSRQDGIDSAFGKKVLRESDIFLDTVKEGKIDWNTFAGRVQDTILSELNHKYSRDLAEHSVRGRQDSFDRGKCPFGRICFGYSRKYTNGTQTMIVKRRESFRKPRGWETEVIINEEEAAVVRFIFSTFAERDISYGQLLRILTKEKMMTPDDNPWHLSGVRYILTNPAYIGICHVGRFLAHQPGAFAHCDSGEKRGIIPSLIDSSTWEIVQAKIAKRKEGAVVPPRHSEYSPLCGILTCGKCGSLMSRNKVKKTNKTYYSYRCCSYSRNPGKGCRGWSVSDQDILPRLQEALVREVDGELLKTLHARPQAAAITDLSILSSQEKELRKKIDQAEDRYLAAPSAMMSGLEKKILAWKEQLAQLLIEIRVVQATRNETGLDGLVRWWEGVKDSLLPMVAAEGRADILEAVSMLAECDDIPPAKKKRALDNAPKFFELVEADKFREFLHRIGCRVVLFFKPRIATSAGAIWRRKNGQVKAGTVRFFEVDWERSSISVDFAWQGESLQVGVPSSSTGSSAGCSNDEITVAFARPLAV